MRAELRLGDSIAKSQRQDVVVIGAGVVGMATGLTLADRGHRVTILDGADGPGRGTSFANGAQLSYAYTDALASPTTIAQIPRLLLARDPAFRLHPGLDPDFLRWSLAFLKNGSSGRYRRNTLRGLVLAIQSRQALHTLTHRHSLDYGLTTPGKVILYRSERNFEAARCIAAHKLAAGAEQVFLNADEAVAVEPMLSSLRNQIAGAIHSPSEEVGDPFQFCVGAHAAFTAAGGESRFATAIARIDTDQARPAAVTADGRRFETDCIILCSGADSAALARSLGVRLPIIPMKGYSITAPPGASAPRVSVTDAVNRVVFARLGSQMRIAGLADLGQRDTRIDPRRLAALIASARSALPEAADYDAIVSTWAGLRPMTPDSLPIIRTIAPGVIANTGHGALGWTYAAGSAERVADILENESREARYR